MLHKILDCKSTSFFSCDVLYFLLVFVSRLVGIYRNQDMSYVETVKLMDFKAF